MITFSRPLAAVAPASPSQEQLWTLLEQYPGQPVGNFPVALSIEGPLDAAVLARALNDVVARHDILRTRFDVVEGRPVQVVASALNVPVPVTDLRLLPEGVREAQAFRLAREEAAQTFDFRRLPLLRTRLFLFEPTRHILVLTLHRGIFDQDSLGILLRELSVCYAARCNGRTPCLPPLSLQYAEYAGQCRQHPTRESCLAWWSERLAGDPAPLQLLPDRGRSGSRTGGSRVEKHELPATLRSAVESLALREDTSPFNLLLTAFQVLLHRYTDRTDFVLGVAVSDRHTPDVENLLGPFAKVVPCRAGLSGDPSFRGLLGRVRREMLDISIHSFHAPLACLPDRFRNPALACPVQFSHARKVAELADSSGLRLQELELDSGSGQCELAFHVVESDGGLGVRAEYDSELFSPAVIQRLLAHFGVLLQGAVARPACRLSELPLLTPAERRRLLSEWNNTIVSYPRDATVHELISTRTTVEPGAVAVTSACGRLSYLELDQRSNQLGRHLRAAGVRPGQLVGLCVERSPQLVIGLLGILKAGGAALPLDPALADTVRSRLVNDTRLNLILTQTPLRHSFSPDINRVLLLDAEAADIQREDDAGLTAVAGPDDLAWVVSTSGTGGQPKSVELSHRAIVSTLYAQRQLSRLAGTDVLLATTPLLSAGAMTELLLPLVFGARLELATAEDMADPVRLAAHTTASHPTVMLAAPSTWRQMVEAGWTGDKSLRILASGEPLTRELADRLLPCCRELWNLYGTAETSGGCLAAPVAPGRAGVVLGRPLGNVQVHLLDARLQPVPVGIPGEIYVGGDTLAAGYRRQPVWTAAQFSPDPFRHLPGARLFRTGDLARRLPNGEIEFLGRLDQQTACRLLPLRVTSTEAVSAIHPYDAATESPAPLPPAAASFRQSIPANASMAPTGAS